MGHNAPKILAYLLGDSAISLTAAEALPSFCPIGGEFSYFVKK